MKSWRAREGDALHRAATPSPERARDRRRGGPWPHGNGIRTLAGAQRPGSSSAETVPGAWPASTRRADRMGPSGTLGQCVRAEQICSRRSCKGLQSEPSSDAGSASSRSRRIFVAEASLAPLPSAKTCRRSERESLSCPLPLRSALLASGDSCAPVASCWIDGLAALLIEPITPGISSAHWGRSGTGRLELRNYATTLRCCRECTSFVTTRATPVKLVVHTHIRTI